MLHEELRRDAGIIGPSNRPVGSVFAVVMGTGIEPVEAGRCYLRKRDQDPALVQSCEQIFEPD
jgi:hypothetical protein